MDLQNVNGETALHYAVAEAARAEFVKLLKHNGANAHLKTKIGDTPLRTRLYTRLTSHRARAAQGQPRGGDRALERPLGAGAGEQQLLGQLQPDRVRGRVRRAREEDNGNYNIMNSSDLEKAKPLVRGASQL